MNTPPEFCSYSPYRVFTLRGQTRTRVCEISYLHVKVNIMGDAYRLIRLNSSALRGRKPVNRNTFILSEDIFNAWVDAVHSEKNRKLLIK